MKKVDVDTSAFVKSVGRRKGGPLFAQVMLHLLRPLPPPSSPAPSRTLALTDQIRQVQNEKRQSETRSGLGSGSAVSRFGHQGKTGRVPPCGDAKKPILCLVDAMWRIWQGDTAKYKVQDHRELARLNKGDRVAVAVNSGLVRAWECFS